MKKWNALRTDPEPCRSLTLCHHPHHLLIIPVYAADRVSFSMSSVKPETLFLLNHVSFQLLFSQQCPRDLRYRPTIPSQWSLHVSITKSCRVLITVSIIVYDLKQCECSMLTGDNKCIWSMYPSSEIQIMGVSAWLPTVTTSSAFRSLSIPYHSWLWNAFAQRYDCPWSSYRHDQIHTSCWCPIMSNCISDAKHSSWDCQNFKNCRKQTLSVYVFDF